MIRKTALVMISLLVLVVSAGAQQAEVPLIGVTNGLLVAYSPTGLNIIEDETDADYNNLALSADGFHLIYTATEYDPYQPTLMWLRRDGVSEPTAITDSYEAYVPPTFGLDGQSVYYVQQAESDSQGGMMMPVNIMRRSLVGGVDAEVIAQSEIGVGCGGGSPFPMDAVYSTEAGFMGNRLVFVVTEAGIAHSSGCQGIGLTLLDPETGTRQVLSEDFGRASLSPDGTQLAGAQIEFTPEGPQTTLTIIDLTDGEVRPIETQAMPDQIHWAKDGRIYYSTRTPTTNTAFSVEETQRLAEQFGFPPDAGLPNYNVAIYRVNIQGGLEEQVYSAEDVWAIGRMQSTLDALYFSQVPNGTAWFELLLSDTGENTWEMEQRIVQPDVYSLPFAGGEATLVREDVSGFVLPPF